MYDYLLNIFRSQDELRPNLQGFHKIGAFVYTTDAHTIIKVPYKKLKHKYTFFEKSLDFKTIIHKGGQESNELAVSVDELLEALAKAHICYGMKECDRCQGEGSIKCDKCDYDHECEDCDGSGDQENQPKSIRFTYSKMGTSMGILIGEKKFQPHYIERLVIVAMAKRVRTIRFLNNTNSSTVGLFKCGDILVGLMPLRVEQNDHE